MATTTLFPKVNVKSVAFDASKWDKTKEEDGTVVYTLKDGQTDTVTVTFKPGGGDPVVIQCGEGSTVTMMPNDYEIVKKP